MLNVIADEAGVGAAVLVRSCAPVAGAALLRYFMHDWPLAARQDR